MREAGEAANRNDRSQTVERALGLLDLVASSAVPLTTQQLATLSGLARPTAYRLLLTLEQLGYLDRLQDHAFALGYKATRMSGVRGSQQALARRARPVLETITAELCDTVNLSVPVGTAVVEIDQVDPPHPVRQMNYINVAFPLHCSSNGKVMLASLSPSELESFLSRPLERRTSRTVTDAAALREQLGRVREDGFGTCVAELYDGINGVSAAVVDENRAPIAFVSVSGPSFRLPEQRLKEAAQVVIEACDAIRQLVLPP